MADSKKTKSKKTTVSKAKKSKPKRKPYLSKADWALVLSLLINLRFDQAIILNYQRLVQLFINKKYTPEYLNTLSQDEYDSLNSFMPKFMEFSTLGLAFFVAAIALLLAVWARENSSSKVLTTVSIIVSSIVMLISVISAIGSIAQM